MMTALAQPLAFERVRVRVRGQVQGVGFRPFVYGLTARYELSGWVLNDGDGVLMEVEGAQIGAFLKDLETRIPPLARIDNVCVEPVSATGEVGFIIRKSEEGDIATSIPADAAVCDECLKELFDPADRHYLYPFLNCTHCGPRYSITRHLPYDRPQTAMAAFAMCADCRTEYENPADRRFHAQPVACGACGPQLSMGVEQIVARLKAGEILAIKGLGGFHIVCDARNEKAVAQLRRRKHRDEKPLAVMTANVISAEPFVRIGDHEAHQLASTARPIVIVPKRAHGALAASIAPGLDSLGVLLPYTPLHYLLFHEAAGRPDGTDWLSKRQDLVLVMTSANPGGEPLVTDNDEAHRRLEGIVDAIVTHDRDIVVRVDDSVQRFIGGVPTFIRRARGFAPTPIKLTRVLPSGLAVGGHLKSTVCVIRKDEAFVSQHIGDLDNMETLAFFEETLAHLLSITDVAPTWVAHDLHPDFLSTRFAQDYAHAHAIPAYPVQHHHAHVSSAVAEHGLSGPVLGLALDGFGLGEGDGSHNWGGEALIADGSEYRRVGHLAALPLPGGEAAFRAPWRMAAAVLHSQGRADEIAARFGALGDVDVLTQMLDNDVNVAPSTSCGRWFDAAAGLLGIQPLASFDGQAPMKLESLVTEPVCLNGAWRIVDGVLDLNPLLGAIADMDPVDGANAFHGTVIEALAAWVRILADQNGLTQVVLSGGCVLNRVLTQGLERALHADGLNVFRLLALPPGDGGISLGQAYIAALRAEQLGKG